MNYDCSYHTYHLTVASIFYCRALCAFKFLDLHMLHHEYNRLSVYCSLSSLVTR